MLNKIMGCLLLIGNMGCMQAQVYPGEHWDTLYNTAEWTASKLKTMERFIIDSTHATGMVVIHKGKMIYQFGDIKELSYLASCRKSICAMLYGPFVENKTINLQETLESLGIDDIGGLLPIEKKATIQHVLNARSGVYHLASNAGDNTDKAPRRGSVQPGTYWLYNNWDFNVAGYILEKKTGRNIYALVDSIFAKPLQLEDWDIKAQHKDGDMTRSQYPAYHMWFSTQDMARFGYLMLRNGKWKDKQIISPAWVRTITSTVTPYEETLKDNNVYYNFGYAYYWWTWDKPFNTGAYKNAYTASGAYGQYITVLPALDAVIAFKTKSIYQRGTGTGDYLKVLQRLVDAYNGRL